MSALQESARDFLGTLHNSGFSNLKAVLMSNSRHSHLRDLPHQHEDIIYAAASQRNEISLWYGPSTLRPIGI